MAGKLLTGGSLESSAPAKIDPPETLRLLAKLQHDRSFDYGAPADTFGRAAKRPLRTRPLSIFRSVARFVRSLSAPAAAKAPAALVLLPNRSRRAAQASPPPRNAPPLFDSDWYLAQNPDVAAASSDPWEHFLSRGAAERRNPHPLFDVAWYLDGNPDVGEAGANPFEHFILSGGSEGRSPHPLFDTKFYLAEYPGAAAPGINPLEHFLAAGPHSGLRPHPLFDPVYYLCNNPAAHSSGLNPLVHYVLSGASQRAEFHPFFSTEFYVAKLGAAPPNPLLHFLRTDRATRPDPHPLFDSRFYVETYGDIASQTVEPLIHFVTHGAAEGRSPHPLFHPVYYLSHHPNPEAARANPLADYLSTGAETLVNPHPLFDSEYYLRQSPACRASAMAPLAHYLAFGVTQRLSPHPLFDAPFYLETNDAVRAAGADPLGHYLREGAWHGADPHPLFDSSWYFQKYPDVLREGRDPLGHWLEFGHGERRAPHPLFDTTYYLLQAGDLNGMNPLQHYLSVGAAQRLDPHPLFHSSYYFERNPGILAAGLNPLVHFVRSAPGERENPHPYFDCSFYLRQCPEIDAPGINPLVHFLASDPALGLDPDPRFDSSFYLEANPAVARLAAESGVNPLVHYVLSGKAAGLAPHPGIPAGFPPYRIDMAPPSAAEFVRQRLAARELDSCPFRPLVSILVPVFNTDPACLRLAIESVLEQLYPNWELCIHDDGSDSEAVQAVLREFLDRDPRIQIGRSSANQGISHATNAALRMARGEFVAFLDHDDEMMPSALAEVVCALNRDPTLDAVYTDQDYIDETGAFSGDFFKPDWSPVLLLGAMYIGHLLVTRRELALSIGGFDPRFDFAQDFEFLLRLSEATSRIAHVPRVLYSWRRIPGSIAFHSGEKPGIESLQASAVNAHFVRRGIPALAFSNPAMAHRMRIYPAPRTCWPEVGVILDSPDASLPPLLDPTLRVRLLASMDDLPPYILFLRGDLKPISPNWIQDLFLYVEFPDVACVAPLIVDSHFSVENAGLIVQPPGYIVPAMAGFDAGADGYAGSLSCAREVSAVPGDCVLIGRENFLRFGFRSEFSSSLYRFADLSLRASRAGLRNILNPRAILQRQSTSCSPTPLAVDRALFREIWRTELTSADPYYNLNFGTSNFGRTQ